MKIISVNIGKPQSFNYKGKQVITSIFKYPAPGKLKVSFTNIEGDEQADKIAHGGELKAIYSYDICYYHHWKNIMQRDDWGDGLFGENLTTEGMSDDKILIGNIYKVGSVYLKAIQPRFPCFKLNIRFDNEDMLQQFMQVGKHGTYFTVVQQGTLQAGNEIKLVEESEHKITIEQLVKSYYSKGADKNIAEQILAINFLPDRLRKAFESF